MSIVFANDQNRFTHFTYVPVSSINNFVNIIILNNILLTVLTFNFKNSSKSKNSDVILKSEVTQ